MDEIREWELSLRASAQRPGTIRLRLHYVRRCLADIGVAPSGVTQRDLIAWMAGQTEWSPSARRSARASLRGFWSWRSRTIGGDDIARDLPTTPMPRGLPRPASDIAILESLRRADARVQLMIELMAYGGLRRCEVATVRPAELRGEWLRVTGKGGHVRLVPLPPSICRRIRECRTGWLFPGQIDGHVSPGHVGKLVNAALPDGVTGHQLRHRYATTVFRNSRDIVAVRELLGHARLDTTMVYTRVDQDGTRAAATGAWKLGAA